MKKINQILDLKQVHKTYLILALTVGTIFSLFMPLFNEPDGQYHLAVSGRIVNRIVDASRYDEVAITTGMDGQESSYKSGTHFEKYYLNKAVFIESKDLPRNIYYQYTNFVYWGHVVPAIGLFIGSLIYPSIGVMVTVGRLLSVLVYSLCTFFIIKKVERAKLLFTVVFLSPVVMNSFASLSYDAAGYVSVAYIMMNVINMIVNPQKNVPLKSIVFSTILTILSSKSNYWLLLLMYPVASLYTENKYAQLCRKKLSLWIDWLKQKKRWLVLLLLVLLLIVSTFTVITVRYGGLLVVIRRFIMTIIFSYGKTMGINSWLVEPYPQFNFIPTWVSAAWILLVSFILLSDTKYVTSKFITWSSIFLFFFGIFGVYFVMLGYGSMSSSYIEGIQGRYFTPTLLLLSLFISGIKMRLNIERRWLLAWTYLLVIFSNSILVFNTVINLMR